MRRLLSLIVLSRLSRSVPAIAGVARVGLQNARNSVFEFVVVRHELATKDCGLRKRINELEKSTRNKKTKKRAKPRLINAHVIPPRERTAREHGAPDFFKFQTETHKE